MNTTINLIKIVKTKSEKWNREINKINKIVRDKEHFMKEVIRKQFKNFKKERKNLKI